MVKYNLELTAMMQCTLIQKCHQETNTKDFKLAFSQYSFVDIFVQNYKIMSSKELVYNNQSVGPAGNTTDNINRNNSYQEDNVSDDQENSLNAFGIAMTLIEIALIALIWVFCRVKMEPSSALSTQRYPAFQDVNVMMLIGFGYLMTFIRSYAWSAISYTFLINAFISQYYILLDNFWHKVFHNGFGDGSKFTIQIDIVTLIMCSYSVASVLVTFGGVMGRVGPKDLLIIGTVHIVGYTLNERIVYDPKLIGMIDAGGSSVIHTYGAYYGLTVCLILSKKIKPITNLRISYISNIFGFIGTLFLWLYWPSFNFALFAQNQFEQNLVVVNTVLSLTGSVLGTYIASALSFGKGLEMESILNSTLAGGVVIGAPVTLIYRPGVAIMIGFTTGIISTLCFHNLTPKLLKCIGLYDTCGVHNLHGIPGLLGGIWSAIILFWYDIGFDAEIASKYSSGYFNIPNGRSVSRQGAFQIAGTFISLGMAIGFGVIGGLISSFFYNQRNKYFYEDTNYFEEAHFNEIYKFDSGENLYLKQNQGVFNEEALEIEIGAKPSNKQQSISNHASY